jgi:hypothetical protein
VGPYAATVSPTPLSRSELLDHLQG